MRCIDARARRRRRLALAGLLWTAFLAANLALGHAHVGSATHGRLPENVGEKVQSRIDQRLGAVVFALSGSRAAVHCWSPADWRTRTAALTRIYGMERLGAWRAYTAVDLRTIHLSPEVCSQLTRLVDDRAPIGRDDSPDALAWSVATLAHEAHHVAGVWNEVWADCLGMQSIRRTARLLGRTSREGRYLARLHWKHWYVWHQPRYRTPQCRNGGPLDLRPDRALWP